MNAPTLSELETIFNKGSGVAIIVEGDSYQQDPFFYRHWFDHLARSITFIPQNGWTQVRKAVSELRQRGVVWPVYGLIDRDFARAEELDQDFSTQGILRTPRYTLENYLLEPEYWAVTLQAVYRRVSQELAILETWGNANYVAHQIEEAYRQCIPLSAYNSVLRFFMNRYSNVANTLPSQQISYLEHPDALVNLDLPSKLIQLQQQAGITDSLVDLYQSHCTDWQGATLTEWQQQVSGKIVLRHLHRRFPNLPVRGKPKLDDYLDRYIDAYPPTPMDLEQAIQRILQDASK